MGLITTTEVAVCITMYDFLIMLHVSEQDRRKGNTCVTVAFFIIITSSRLEDAQSPTLYLTWVLHAVSKPLVRYGEQGRASRNQVNEQAVHTHDSLQMKNNANLANSRGNCYSFLCRKTAVWLLHVSLKLQFAWLCKGTQIFFIKIHYASRAMKSIPLTSPITARSAV